MGVRLVDRVPHLTRQCLGRVAVIRKLRSPEQVDEHVAVDRLAVPSSEQTEQRPPSDGAEHRRLAIVADDRHGAEDRRSLSRCSRPPRPRGSAVEAAVVIVARGRIDRRNDVRRRRAHRAVPAGHPRGRATTGRAGGPRTGREHTRPRSPRRCRRRGRRSCRCTCRRPHRAQGGVGARHAHLAAQPPDVGGHRPLWRAGGQHVLPPHRRPHRGSRAAASCARATSPRSVTRRSTPWPTRAAAFTGAIHVYGGDITSRPGRSEWDQDSGVEVPYDFARAKQFFVDANEHRRPARGAVISRHRRRLGRSASTASMMRSRLVAAASPPRATRRPVPGAARHPADGRARRSARGRGARRRRARRT